MGSALNSAIALVSATDMNQYLGVTVTTAGTSTEEIESDNFNNAAGRLALSWTGRTALVLATALTEYYQGDYTSCLETKAWPISAVTQVWVDPSGAFTGSSGTVYDATDYQIDSEGGRIFLTAGVFPRGNGGSNGVKLTYSAGYSTVPYDLQLAWGCGARPRGILPRVTSLTCRRMWQVCLTGTKARAG
jgi:hypothetical protein